MDRGKRQPPAERDDSLDDIPAPRTRKETLRLFIARSRALNYTRANESEGGLLVQDPYFNASAAIDFMRKPTGYIHVMAENHRNQWDPKHIEKPERTLYIHKKCDKLGLIKRMRVFYIPLCQLLPEDIIERYVNLYHAPTLAPRLEKLCKDSVEAQFAEYDSLYASGEETFKGALNAVEASIILSEAVGSGEIQNGFANIRPPGHHATKTTPNGFCFFNNVVISALYLLKRKFFKRILIVDIDVHHGQGTQEAFYDRNDVLYFSIHRYEHGKFWPNLREGNVDHIGNSKGKGFNINVPLNETGMNDVDYITIVTQLLLPVAYEFAPDVVLVSAGYDAAVGCPEGRMNVSPAFYGHLITMLSVVANGKIICLLEGGYCTDSLAAGAASTIKALLGDACDPIECRDRLKPSVIDTINDVKYFLRPYWTCFRHEKLAVSRAPAKLNRFDEHVVVLKYVGKPDVAPFATRNTAPTVSHTERVATSTALAHCLPKYYMKKPCVGYTYDEIFLEHKPKGTTSNAQELPDRLEEVYNKLSQFGLLERMTFVPMLCHDEKRWMSQVHNPAYIHDLMQGNFPEQPDLYHNKVTTDSMKWAIRHVLALIDEIHTNRVHSGIALIRPPGHHAEHARGGGFCFINNAVIAANYLIESFNLKRVMIIDFDVHHGNGTQDLTYDRKDIFYLSIHRFDDANFYPKTEEGNYGYLGKRDGFGYNVNIPFNNVEKASNFDYMTVWLKFVLPLAYEYNPDFIIVSAGFDAGVNDPLGHYCVNPETFGHMIQTLKPIAKIAMLLEGGYNKTTTSLAMALCVKSLLGDPLPYLDYEEPKPKVVELIEKMMNLIKPMHPILEVNKALNKKSYTQEQWEKLCENLK